MDRTNEFSSLQRHNRRFGLVFGLFMGLAYAFVAWGLDALRLYNSAAFLPWLKLAVGGSCALLLGGAVGWFVGHLDHGGAGLIGWALVGVALNTLAGHLPYEGYAFAGGLLDPRFQGLDTFPYVLASGARQTMATLVAGGLIALAGLLEPFILEQAHAAPSRIGQALALLIAAPAFLLAGYWTDDFVNRPLRDPQVAVADLLQTVLYTPDLTRQERLDLHVGALNAIADLLSEPRLLMVNHYDPNSMTSASIEIEFPEAWARCFVIAKQLTFCQPSDPLLTEAFLCILAGDEAQAGSCRGEASPEVAAWLAQARPRLGSEPELEVTGRMGAIALLEGRAQDGASFACRLYGSMPVVIGSCGFDSAP